MGFLSVLKRIKRLFSMSWVWRKPCKADILLIDAAGIDVLAPYLSDFNLHVCYIRGEEVSLPCLVNSLVDPLFWRRPTLAYLNSYCAAVSPSVCMTYIDNNTLFYEMSSGSAKKIFLQNGLRDDYLLRFADSMNSFYVDYMLSFSEAYASYFMRYIGGRSLVVGSFKNNDFLGIGEVSLDLVVYVSSYSPPSISSDCLFENSRGECVYWHEFIVVDRAAVLFVAKWCARHDRRLVIAGCGKGGDSERFWYDDLLCGYKYEFVQKTSPYGSYELIDKAGLVVGTDSALLYEAFGRGKKTAFFSGRGASLRSESYTRRFGWPNSYPDNGPFWTNFISDEEFERVLDYIGCLGRDEWLNVWSFYGASIMAYDSSNIQFKNLLNELIFDDGTPGD